MGMLDWVVAHSFLIIILIVVCFIVVKIYSFYRQIVMTKDKLKFSEEYPIMTNESLSTFARIKRGFPIMMDKLRNISRESITNMPAPDNKTHKHPEKNSKKKKKVGRPRVQEEDLSTDFSNMTRMDLDF